MTDWDSIKAIATAFVDLADNTDDTDLSRLRKMARTLLTLTQDPPGMAQCDSCGHSKWNHGWQGGCLKVDGETPCKCPGWLRGES